MLASKKGASFGTIVGVIGAILIGLGVVWLLAQNWHQIPSALKIIILFAVTAAAYTAGTALKVRKYPGTGKALIVLGSLLYTWSVFLIAQIFSTSASIQGMAWLMLISWVGVIIASYMFESAVSMVLGLVGFVCWVNTQLMAFWIRGDFFGSGMFVPGIFALVWLALSILFYGLSLWHRAKSNDFARLYVGWTGFFLLAFGYLLSFQTILPWLWPKTGTYPISALAFLFVFGLLAIVSVVSGAAVSRGKNAVSQKELMWFSFAVVLLLALVGAASLVSKSIEGGSYYGGFFGGSSFTNVPPQLWGIWIFSNVIFIVLILGVIGYGTWQRVPRLVNMGIAFFALDIIARYIGFMMDFWGYTSLSVIFITGGLLLIFGGWLIERWRRNLIAKAK